MFWWGKQRVISVCSPEMFKDTIKLTYRPSRQTIKCLITFLLLILELLFTLFEPMIGPSSIQYANGLDWEERRKWLYPTLRGKSLEDYIPIFIKVDHIFLQLPQSTAIAPISIMMRGY